MRNSTITPRKSNVKAKCRYFQAEGNSMNNGKIYNAITDGMVLQCSEVPKEQWVVKIPDLIAFSCVFVMDNGDNILKSVYYVSSDCKTITLRNLNPNKEEYPDFIIELANVRSIYIVDKRII